MKLSHAAITDLLVARVGRDGEIDLHFRSISMPGSGYGWSVKVSWYEHVSSWHPAHGVEAMTPRDEITVSDPYRAAVRAACADLAAQLIDGFKAIVRLVEDRSTRPGKMPEQIYECGRDSCPGTAGTSHPTGACPGIKGGDACQQHGEPRATPET